MPRLESLVNSWNVLSISANLGFQTPEENPHFYETGTCQGDIPFHLEHVARIKQCVENCRFNFQKDNGLKTAQVRIIFFPSLDSKICLGVWVFWGLGWFFFSEAYLEL